MANNNQKNSLLCPGCRKLISRSEPVCPFCGLTRPASRFKNNIFVAGITNGDQLIKIIIAANIIMFILSIIIDPRRGSLNMSPFSFLSPSNQSLLVLGSTGTVPVLQLHRWWSLLAANYLHGGLLHIVFNMLAFRQLAPLVIQEFGINRTITLYTLGGVGGFVLSTLAGVYFTIGASAALCSLIGALLYYGKSRGGIYGQNIFSQVGGWAIGIGIFGFLVPGINNWGHGGGMLAGAVLGYLLGYQEKKREMFRDKVLAMVCLGATGLILLWSCLNGVLFLFLRFY
ncbi:rhomboid family intramembrane serine protease [Desulfopila sp. IMCC35006]|uniref:rhomboid family intramembrane serine protease n=1 Tax=Desulfopila sp. IMCC35006 TaxID=2569542 RepID=UPI0010AC6933|nr:rhomboid family intramembrane serine protease [Desulfopila sp. IMCC35006]TKB28487.1 rhomboid family intramembrane serine protease [Desulfopila sp. IMCC35006]